MQINIDEDRENFKALTYPAPELVTVIHGADGPETLVLSADELADLNWPVTIDDKYRAHIIVPVRGTPL